MIKCGDCKFWRSVSMQTGKVGAGECHHSPLTALQVIAMTPDGPRPVIRGVFPPCDASETGCGSYVGVEE